MEKILSLAYQHSVNFPSNKQYESIDLLSSDVDNVSLDGYPNLQRIRISKCKQLQNVNLSNMPKLQVVDLLDNEELVSVVFDKCPSITTVDTGYCFNIKKLKGISNVEYLSAPCCYNLKLEQLNKIVFLNITEINDIDVKDIIKNSPKLECLSCTSSSTLNLSDITKNPSLTVLQLSSGGINFDSVDKGTHLKIIIFEHCTDYRKFIHGDTNLLNQFYVADSLNANQDIRNVLNIDEYIPKYQSYQKLLYGPWGVPDVDRLPPVKVKGAVIKPPEGVNQQKAADAIVGSIMASAAMDMIGVGVEFINSSISKPLLLGKMDITWSHPRCNDHNERFVRGTPTDDTSQSILIMRSIVELNSGAKPNIKDTSSDDENLSKLITIDNVRIDPKDFGKKLIEWIENGHKEHRHDGGLGCGSTTYAVVSHRKYETDPIFAAQEVWIRSGKKVAPNGSVMRIASSGAFAFWDENVVVQHADKYARVTHADPRCVYSSIAAALLIARYIQWNAGLREKEPNIDDTLSDAKKFVPDLDQYKSDIDFYSNCKTVEELELSGDRKIGYCLKAFGSAVWALRYCNSIEEGLVKVIREGGDSDTNGAVVGALLGAKFGFHAIPKEFVDYMFVGQWMFREMTPYMNLMGIEMLPSPYM